MIGSRLRAAREAADLTQQEVSDRTGLSRTSITNMEAGRQEPGAETIAALARAIGIHPGDLFPRTETCEACEGRGYVVTDD